MIIESFYYKLREMTKDVPAEMLNRSMLNPVLGTNLHTIYSGGAYLNPELIDFFAQFDINLVQGYGMTEFSPRISQNIRGYQKKGSVGALIPGCEAKIEDGELWVKGNSRMIGYYKDDQATNEAISGEWLRTGDLAKIDEDNFVFLTGRKKNLIILSNGENVSPEELENKFNGWLVAKELMIYSAEGRITCEIFPNSDFVAMAGITDVEAAFAQKVEEVNTDLPLYKRITKTIVRENEFDKTASGKIKRKHNQ
jgi:long-chain acyl-CoA synthetase